MFVASPAVPSDFSFLSFLPVVSPLHWSRSDFLPLLRFSWFSFHFQWFRLPRVDWSGGWVPAKPTCPRRAVSRRSFPWLAVLRSTERRTPLPSRLGVGTFDTGQIKHFSGHSPVPCLVSRFPSYLRCHPPAWLFRELLLHRLWFPFLLASRTFRCSHSILVAHHRAACSTAEVLGSRGFSVESAVARFLPGSRGQGLDRPLNQGFGFACRFGRCMRGGGRGWLASLRAEW